MNRDRPQLREESWGFSKFERIEFVNPPEYTDKVYNWKAEVQARFYDIDRKRRMYSLRNLETDEAHTKVASMVETCAERINE